MKGGLGEKRESMAKEGANNNNNSKKKKRIKATEK